MSCFCFVCIPEMNVGLVEDLGKFSTVLTPGLSCINYPMQSLRATVSLKMRQFDLACDTKTKDNVFVEVKVAVLYRVVTDKAVTAFYKLSNHETQMRSYIFDGIRSSLPKLDLDDAFASKDEIADHVKVDLTSIMADYGYIIEGVLITDITPDATVQRAMNDINAQVRLREAATYKADAEKILLVKAAEADSEAKYLTGVGVAKQRRALMDGLQSSVTEFAKEVNGATAKDVMDLLLVTQYFDTLREIGGKNSGVAADPKTLFLPHGPASVSELRKQMEASFMGGMKR